MSELPRLSQHLQILSASQTAQNGRQATRYNAVYSPDAQWHQDLHRPGGAGHSELKNTLFHVFADPCLALQSRED